ncbi:MAG: hypothetical protein WD397_10085 [Wenzhouxiangellaceae bacterium]
MSTVSDVVVSMIPLIAMAAIIAVAMWVFRSIFSHLGKIRLMRWGDLVCQLHDRGELSDEEFKSACTRVKRELDMTAGP